MGLDEVHHRAEAQTVDDIADGAAHDGPDCQHFEQVIGPPQPGAEDGDDRQRQLMPG